jgi:hypothetical protein
MKLTKQGVRNLDHLPSISKGVRLPEPPVPVACKHKSKREVDFYGLCLTICNDCDKTLSEY